MLRSRRSANVQQLNLLETSLPQKNNDRVWTSLDDEQRTRILDMLARLIARIITAQNGIKIVRDIEDSHD